MSKLELLLEEKKKREDLRTRIEAALEKLDFQFPVSRKIVHKQVAFLLREKKSKIIKLTGIVLWQKYGVYPNDGHGFSVYRQHPNPENTYEVCTKCNTVIRCREYYYRDCPKCRLDYYADYHRRHREKRIEYYRWYYDTHKDL